ncbi:hypothetical protein NEIRO03_2445 [Nematocida sp. AWRm78]|nr:hypothetical protein NEIRO02_2426 [Nematocida sp. AWRm79]KAI5187050.1 hypothetical protein NEIRO03_2445 [Nematocida sp. AWRm78]
MKKKNTRALLLLSYIEALAILIAIWAHISRSQSKSEYNWISRGVYVHAESDEESSNDGSSPAPERDSMCSDTDNACTYTTPPPKIIDYPSELKKNTLFNRMAAESDTFYCVEGVGQQQEEPEIAAMQKKDASSEQNGKEIYDWINNATVFGFTRDRIKTPEPGIEPERYAKISNVFRLIDIIQSIVPKLNACDTFFNPYVLMYIFHEKDEVVIRSTRVSGKTEEKTLWEVLQACSDGIGINEDTNDSSTIDTVTITCPSHNSEIVKYALLSYFNACKAHIDRLVLVEFEFLLNKNVFDDYTLFFSMEKLLLVKTEIHISTLNLLRDCTNMRELCFDRVKFEGDPDTILTLPHTIEKLKIHSIKAEYVNCILRGTADCHNLREIDIGKIKYMSTDELNNIKTLENVHTFYLNDIVFNRPPDFTFLKRAYMLQELGMCRVFYSYPEEVSDEEDSDGIKQNPIYFNPDTKAGENSRLSMNSLNSLKVLKEQNRTIGEYISPVSIHVDSTLYAALGLYKIEPWKECIYTLCIELGCVLLEPFARSIKVSFLLDAQQRCLSINVKSATSDDSSAALCIKQTIFPFLHLKTIKEIEYVSQFKRMGENKTINVFSEQIAEYARYNSVDRLYILSPDTLIPMNIYRIAVLNKNMPCLSEMILNNIIFTENGTVPESREDASNLQFYTAQIKNMHPIRFNYKLIRRENRLEFTDDIPASRSHAFTDESSD